ncbi:MAG: HAD family hydrolase [Chloroflexi bacterium]|nr:HAD family hydrolase [Chloroflexota bacterium]
MAFKTIFFDWYNTLAHHDPPNEELQLEACRSYGITIDPQLLRAGLAEADRYIYEENAKLRIDKRTPSEQVEIYTYYEDIVLKKAGAGVPRGMALPIYMRVRDMAASRKFALFDDVLPTLNKLKMMLVTTGLISNMPKDMTHVLAELGVSSLLDHVITSTEAGADKPDQKIFQYALSKANVQPWEALHVGDQYHMDVVGARNAGMVPMLLDRHGDCPETDCQRIASLEEVLKFV